jgi:hypothetical protein
MGHRGRSRCNGAVGNSNTWGYMVRRAPSRPPSCAQGILRRSSLNASPPVQPNTGCNRWISPNQGVSLAVTYIRMFVVAMRGRRSTEVLMSSPSYLTARYASSFRPIARSRQGDTRASIRGLRSLSTRPEAHVPPRTITCKSSDSKRFLQSSRCLNHAIRRRNAIPHSERQHGRPDSHASALSRACPVLTVFVRRPEPHSRLNEAAAARVMRLY